MGLEPVRAMTGDDSGRTLVETMVVIGVAGMLAAGAAIAVGTANRRLRFETAAGDLAGTLLAAKARAALSARDVAVTFDLAGRRYATVADPGAAGPPGAAVRLPATASFAAPGQGPAVVLPAGSPAGSAVFTPRGRLRGDGEAAIALADRGLGLYRRVTVSPSGNVVSERWDGKRWTR